MTDPINATTAGGTGQSTQARQTLSTNYEDFLKLLTTQLKNQDPTSPTDTDQLTQQIATLSQVEQQINTNKNLETLIHLFNATQYNSVVSYIGKQIEANGNAGALQDGQARFAYYLGAEAELVNVTVSDAQGNTVYTGESEGTALGRHEFIWDGKNTTGGAMPDGTYTIKVEAKDASNNPVAAKVFTTGIVQSVDSAGGTVYLSFGDLSIPLPQVISVREAPQEA